MSQADALERQMLELINAERALVGAGALQLELNLNQAAEDHSLWMIAVDAFSHTGVGGSSPGARMASAGFDFSGSYGWAENIAGRTIGGPAGFSDEVVGLHTQLMNSSGHRANLLNASYDYIGIGIEVGEYNGATWAFVTQNFGRTGGSVDLDVASDGGGADPDPGNGGGGADPDPGNGTANAIFGDANANTLRTYSGNDILSGEAYNPSFDPAAFQAFRLYQATLDRAPDVPGLVAWANALASGMPALQAVGGFVGSAEFQAKYGATNNGQFVTLLYNNVLDRDPDAGGYAAWLNALNSGMSRQEVVLRFANSQEFIEKTGPTSLSFSAAALSGEVTADIFRLYQATLDREPDAGGLVGWANHLALGATKLSVVGRFVGSAEYQAKYGATDNGQFLTLLYENVLDRAPDPGGYAAWLNALNNGMSREQVVLGFSDGAEFIATTEPDVFSFMRSAATANLRDLLDGGADDDAAIGGLGADTFEFMEGEGGNDLVGDLEPWDWVRFDGFGYSDKSDVLEQMIQSGADVEFSDQGQTIVFSNTVLSDFTDDTFQLV